MRITIKRKPPIMSRWNVIVEEQPQGFGLPSQLKAHRLQEGSSTYFELSARQEISLNGSKRICKGITAKHENGAYLGESLILEDDTAILIAEVA